MPFVYETNPEIIAIDAIRPLPTQGSTPAAVLGRSSPGSSLGTVAHRPWADCGGGRTGAGVTRRRRRGAPCAPVVAGNAWLRLGPVDEQRRGGVEEDQGRLQRGAGDGAGRWRRKLGLGLLWPAATAIMAHRRSGRARLARLARFVKRGGELGTARVVGEVVRASWAATWRMAGSALAVCVGSTHKRGMARRRAHGYGVVYSDDFDVSIHRHNAGKLHGRRGPDVRATRWARRRCRQSPVLFRLSLFEIARLQKLWTKLKFSKNKSCRGAIDLQLSQRASYIFINRFVGKTCWRCRNSALSYCSQRVQLEFKQTFTQNFNVCQLWKMCSRK
jgi:hypothetical protein